ncbi:MAG: hypothetical protein M3M99_01795, partial [Actinomycetota bacterium]|nr:hypothetical protein [Actinomycetota bacterium]
FEATVAKPPLVGRALGTESRAYLGSIAATPTPAGAATELASVAPASARELVPLRRSCGRYIDWYSLSPGTDPSALDGIEAPVVHPPQSED